ncbi:hypothetical protein U1708_05710 [Sphingomonas sp. ZB1N12]|uniref:hypothetical protein n=1 Tax=Sphingomonas arabinosi TaxID=3096160 RepID=UPI002FC6849D
MNPFSMVVCIVLIVMAAKVLTARYRAMGDDPAKPTDSIDALRLRDEERWF